MKATRMPVRLFLYGSLLTGGGRRLLKQRLNRLIRSAVPAAIQARLYDLGAYPGAVAPKSPRDQVYGLVVTLDDPRLLRRIDRYEDYFPDRPAASEFIRSAVKARLLTSGKEIDCWVYLYNRRVIGKPPIPSGDYLHHQTLRRNKWLKHERAAS